MVIKHVVLPSFVVLNGHNLATRFLNLALDTYGAGDYKLSQMTFQQYAYDKTLVHKKTTHQILDLNDFIEHQAATNHKIQYVHMWEAVPCEAQNTSSP